MRRVLVRFTLAPTMPPLVEHRAAGVVLTPFGRWLRERVASCIPEWPSVGFHRIDLTDDGLELLLLARDHARTGSAFEAVRRKVWRDTSRGAVRCGWTRSEMWVAADIVLERRQPRARRLRRGDAGMHAAPVPPATSGGPAGHIS